MGELKPDFKKAYAVANDVLLMSHTIMTLPADIHGHIKNETEIKLYTYETANRKFGIDMSFFGSEDALITEMGGRYILFYKKMIDQHRMIWSIAHESGHYYLGHNLDFKSLSKEQYRVLEIEADFFAAQVLMPDQVIWELVKRGETTNRENIIRWFNVSGKAASKRMETLNRQSEYRDYYMSHNDYESILLKFGSFVEQISPKKYWQSSYEDEEEMQKERDSWLY